MYNNISSLYYIYIIYYIFNSPFKTETHKVIYDILTMENHDKYMNIISKKVALKEDVKYMLEDH